MTMGRKWARQISGIHKDEETETAFKQSQTVIHGGRQSEAIMCVGLQ